jgi:outer membrane immunogenic protein
MEKPMKKFLFGTIGLVAIGLAAPASAADITTKAPPAPPPPPPIYDWSGFYIGGNGGWAQSHNCWDFVGPDGTLITPGGCLSGSGGVAGGQVGYRWQSNQLVVGLEAQGDWADLNRTQTSLINPLFSTRVKTDAIGLFTGQIGWAWNASLLYVKGGAAVTGNRFDILRSLDGINVVGGGETRWGASVGGGWEFGFAPNWSIGVEYDHLFMGQGNNTFSFPVVVNPIVADALNRIRQDVDMVTVRINYRIGGYGAFTGPTGY